MFSTISLVIELLLLMSLALLIYDRARHVSVHGTANAVSWLLVGLVLVCLVVGLGMFGNYRNAAQKLADPYTAANLESFLATNRPTQNATMRAQRTFLATGEVTMFKVGGEMIRFVPTESDIISRSKIAADVTRRTAENETRLTMALFWSLIWIPAGLIGFVVGRQELRYLTANHGFQRLVGKRTFAEVDGLINMLRGACEDPALYKTLELILTQPDRGRKAMLRELIAEMRAKQAPRDLTDAFICLMDDGAAEKAYTVIYKCERAPAAVAA
jgi:hypothetical protein